MESGRGLLILTHLLIHLHLHLVGLTIAQTTFSYRRCQPNYTSNSANRTNLDEIPSSIYKSNITYGFYNFSIGQSPNTVNVIGLCRGDVSHNICVNCLSDSYTYIRQLCTNQTESIGWYDNCMLRYSPRSIFRTVESLPHAYQYVVSNASNVAQFNQMVRSLLDSLRVETARGGSTLKFATRKAAGPGNLMIYALAQCTPDLSAQQCNECLNETANILSNCCEGRTGARVLLPSCNFRYDITPFYATTLLDASPPADVPLPASPPPLADVPLTRSSPLADVPASPPGNKDKTIIIIVVVTVVSVILLVCICIFIRKRKQTSVERLQYDFNIIRVATDDFSMANKLGEGGFGVVYKGRLKNGQEIAVKKLSMKSGHGDQEFKNDVMLMAKLQHMSLVRLLGFCLEGTERLLIYEFMSNESLEHLIFDPEKRAKLDTDCLYKIIDGVAQGLRYLHEISRPQIIHQNLKASNILLDEKMNPKISDFDMARLFAQGETQGSMRKIVGTNGYMAPEYANLGQFSIKSDVFSFGVLVLEILMGEKNISFRRGDNVEDLLSYAWKKWQDGEDANLIDPPLTDGSDSKHDITRCIQIGLLCVQEKIDNRPTMGSVVNMLNSSSLTLSKPSQPGFCMPSSIDQEMSLLTKSDNSGAT